MLLMILGRNEEAAAVMENALDADPLSPEMRIWLVHIHFMLGHYESALKEALRVVEIDPGNFMTHFALGVAYLSGQKYEDSIAGFRKAVEYSGGLPLTLGWLGLALGLGGKTEEARLLA